VPVNLGQIQAWIDRGRLAYQPGQLMTMRDLYVSGLANGIKHGVKILAKVGKSVAQLLWCVSFEPGDVILSGHKIRFRCMGVWLRFITLLL
jgi:hypothetical protein